MKSNATIYVALLNEGVNCMRPVEAYLQDDGTYLLSGPAPEDEQWQFAPGAVVVCEKLVLPEGEIGLVAVRQLR